MRDVMVRWSVTQIPACRSYVRFSDSCGFSKQLKMLMQSPSNLQSHHEVLPKNFCFWLPSVLNSTFSYSHIITLSLSKEGQKHGGSCLFPDEMSQESNMSSCRGFTVVSRHLVARLSEHVREAHPTRKLQQYSWHQSIVARTRYE